MTPAPSRPELRQLLDAIVGELRGLGWWSDAPPPPEAFASAQAFFADTMAFPTWLQFVLVPGLEACVHGDAALPSDSQVGAYAIRELDGYHEAADLVSLLCRLDEVVRSAG